MCHTISWFTDMSSGQCVTKIVKSQLSAKELIDFLWCSQKFSSSFTACKNRREFSQWPGCVWLTCEFMLCHRSPAGGSESLQYVKRPLWLWHAAGWCKTEVIFPLWVKMCPSAPAASFPTHHFHVNSALWGCKLPSHCQRISHLDYAHLASVLRNWASDRSHNRMWELQDVVVYLFFFLLLPSVVITSVKGQVCRWWLYWWTAAVSLMCQSWGSKMCSC